MLLRSKCCSAECLLRVHGACMCYVDLSGIHALMLCVWAPPLMEVLHCHALNVTNMQQNNVRFLLGTCTVIINRQCFEYLAVVFFRAQMCQIRGGAWAILLDELRQCICCILNFRQYSCKFTQVFMFGTTLSHSQFERCHGPRLQLRWPINYKLKYTVVRVSQQD